MDDAGIDREAAAYGAEAFALLGISLLITALRTYYRARSVGVKYFQADDYFVLLGAVAQILETFLSYASVAVSRGLANNSMNDEHRARLSPEGHEYRIRVIGSKIQVAGWLTYACAIWSLKAAVCTFYLRLVSALWKFRRRIIGAFVATGVGFVMVVLAIFLSCRPFHRMWQINPNPRNSCQAEISTVLLVTLYLCNIITDLYLISIPLPILFETSLRTRLKIGLCFVFCCAIFIIIAASIRVGLIMTHPAESARISGPWAVRETFVAVIVTNLLVLFPCFKTWLGSFFKSSIRLLSHPTRLSESHREKDLEKQVGTGGTNGGGHQRRRTLSLAPRTSRGTARSGMCPIRFSRIAGPYGTPARDFDVGPGGSTGDSGPEYDESSHGSNHLGERDWGHEDKAAALNRTGGRGPEGIVAPVPPCKIRKDVDVSVEEGGPTSRPFGNFTSAWGPKRKPPGPDLPLDMRTPYLVDHLQPEPPRTETNEPGFIRRLTGDRSYIHDSAPESQV